VVEDLDQVQNLEGVEGRLVEVECLLVEVESLLVEEEGQLDLLKPQLLEVEVVMMKDLLHQVALVEVVEAYLGEEEAVEVAVHQPFLVEEVVAEEDLKLQTYQILYQLTGLRRWHWLWGSKWILCQSQWGLIRKVLYLRQLREDLRG